MSLEFLALPWLSPRYLGTEPENGRFSLSLPLPPSFYLLNEFKRNLKIYKLKKHMLLKRECAYFVPENKDCGAHGTY